MKNMTGDDLLKIVGTWALIILVVWFLVVYLHIGQGTMTDFSN